MAVGGLEKAYQRDFFNGRYMGADVSARHLTSWPNFMVPLAIALKNWPMCRKPLKRRWYAESRLLWISQLTQMPCLVFAATVLSIAGGDLLTRYAIFEGRVRPGMDSEMRDYVNNVLAPLWRQFDGASTVRVMFGVEQDPDGPSFPLVLAITYLDAAAMARGLPVLHAISRAIYSRIFCQIY